MNPSGTIPLPVLALLPAARAARQSICRPAPFREPDATGRPTTGPIINASITTL